MFVLKEHVINVCSVIHIALHAKWMTARCSKEQRLPLVKFIVVIITNIIVIISFLFDQWFAP